MVTTAQIWYLQVSQNRYASPTPQQRRGRDSEGGRAEGGKTPKGGKGPLEVQPPSQGELAQLKKLIIASSRDG